MGKRGWDMKGWLCGDLSVILTLVNYIVK